MIRKKLTIACVLVSLVTCVQFAHAQAIYSYTGNTFTTASGPFAVANVSGSVTLDAAPGAGTVLVTGNPTGNTTLPFTPSITAFSFTADGIAITDVNADPFSVVDLTFSNGVLTDWTIQLLDGLTGDTISTVSGGLDFATNATTTDTGQGASNPNGWSSDQQVIPEPASLAIWSVIMGMGVVVGWSRSRKKQRLKPPG